MIKIPCLFQRDFTDKRNPVLLRTVTPGCEWVLAGEGVVTRKFDGTAVLIKDEVLYARYDAKKGKAPPAGAIPASDPDPVTGHHPHWVRADRPEDRWIIEAFRSTFDDYPVKPEDGTYEAVGPKINGNHDGYDIHMLVRHGSVVIHNIERTWDRLQEYLACLRMEGFVFHHPDGRMVKIRRVDYGMSWP